MENGKERIDHGPEAYKAGGSFTTIIEWHPWGEGKMPDKRGQIILTIDHSGNIKQQKFARLMDNQQPSITHWAYAPQFPK